MDHFESTLKTLLERDGYWVRQSFKVNLDKAHKRQLGKPSMPRPEIDLLAFRPADDSILVLEAKSFLDSPGVDIAELRAQYAQPSGRYKLFTCASYRQIVLDSLQRDLIALGMAASSTRLVLGLAAGNVYQGRSAEIAELFAERGWLFWSPEDIRRRLVELAGSAYENDPAIITSKLLLRGQPTPETRPPRRRG